MKFKKNENIKDAKRTNFFRWMALLTLIFVTFIAIYCYRFPLVSVLGFYANLTSLILWLPQARITWRNRNNAGALEGVSYGTQIIAGVNTILWCVYGLEIHSYWLAMGTIIILPLALFTIVLKFKAERK